MIQEWIAESYWFISDGRIFYFDKNNNEIPYPYILIKDSYIEEDKRD